jgi:hypothetical protein
MFAPLKNTLGAGPHERSLQTAVNGDWNPTPACCCMRPVAKTKPVRCEDCFFHQNQLCALNLGKPCTTFRAAERGLAPEQQLAFVFRSERRTAAYAFPQPNA